MRRIGGLVEAQLRSGLRLKGSRGGCVSQIVTEDMPLGSESLLAKVQD